MFKVGTIVLVVGAGLVAQEIKKVPIHPTPASSGQAMFTTYCAACHGAGGKGDGPAANALKKRPADLTQLARKNNGTLPDVRVMTFITGDEAIAAHGSRDMPAKHFLQLMLHQTGQARPRVINVDGHPAYATAIAELKQSGELGRRCRCRPSTHMNKVLEQDHRFIKKRIAASLWFRSVGGALNTIAGYESMHMIRKGQLRWLPKGDVVGQVWFIHQVYGIAA
jgi:cytochrome c553